MSVRNIVVPLDGSNTAEEALPMAVAIAGRTGATIHLVHARWMLGAILAAAEHDEARAYMEATRERIAQEGVAVKSALIPDEVPTVLLPTPRAGSIGEMLLEYAAAKVADVVVMTTHGRGGLSRKWFGSVAEALLRNAKLPILLIRSGAERTQATPAAITRVVVPIAADDEPNAILAAARRVAGPFGPRFTLVRILPPPHFAMPAYLPEMVFLPATGELEEQRAESEERLRDIAGTLADAAVDIEARVAVAPAPGILAVADEVGADLIVMGTHSREGVERVLLGSVADKVVRGAECAVLVVPPGARA